jgi:hypothetical protein
MASDRKVIIKILDDISPSQVKLRNLSRPIDGLNNMFINELGQVEKRKGYAKYNTDSIGDDHAITGLHRFYNESDSSKELLTAWNTKLYKLASTAGHAATALTSKTGTDYTHTADAETFFANFYDHCYIVNGKDAVAKYKTHVRSVGMTVPTAPTLNKLIDGDLDEEADYYFKVTYVDEDGYESNGGTASAALTSGTSGASEDGIKINIPTSSDDKVVKRRIYRTTGNGAIYYYDGEVADNSTTSYSSTKADNLLGSRLHITHGIPPSGSHLICKRRNKMYYGHEESIYWSETTSPDYVDAAWFMKTGGREKITGMIEQLSVLPVMTQASIERLAGTDTDNFEFKNTFSFKGNYAPRSICMCENLVFYLSFDGIYYFDGTQSQELNKKLSKYIQDNLNEAYIDKSAAVYYKGLYLLSYPKGANTVNSETIIIDIDNKSFSVYNFGFSCYSLWNRMGDGEQLFSGSTSVGRVYELFSDHLDDDGSAIACYDKTDFMDFGIPDLYKDFRDIYIKVKSTTGTALRMYYTLFGRDGMGSETYKDLTMTANKTQWYRVPLIGGGQEGRSIQIRPYVSDKYDVTFMGYMIVFDTYPEEY